MQHSEAALSRDMEELCGQISTAAKAAADDRLAAEKQIAELQSLLHTARAETAQVRAFLYICTKAFPFMLYTMLAGQCFSCI